MKLLYGTGNEAKLASMKRALSNLKLDLIGLKDLEMDIPQVKETGNSPLDNARIKAKAYYNTFCIPVFSCDSGLYFEGLPAEIQPGVNVRYIKGKRLNDEEMIAYYSGLAKKYGNIVARYKNAICLVMDEHKVYESMADDLSGDRFIITDKAHDKRVNGFPIDSLSIHIPTGEYYYNLDKYQADEIALEQGFQRFFKNTLGEDIINENTDI
jgi:8-oxo-dGTP diphosphatase